jgi:hypothetical protein
VLEREGSTGIRFGVDQGRGANQNYAVHGSKIRQRGLNVGRLEGRQVAPVVGSESSGASRWSSWTCRRNQTVAGVVCMRGGPW